MRRQSCFALCSVGAVAFIIPAAVLPGFAQAGAQTIAVPRMPPAVFHGSVLDLPPVPVSSRAKFDMPDPGASGEKSVSAGARRAAAAQLPGRAAPMPPAIENFAGLAFTSTCVGGQCGASIPPSANGDVGLNHFIQGVDDAYAIYDKQGNLLAAFTENSLFSTLGGVCGANSQGTSSVNYDRLNDRWLLSNVAYGLSGGNPVSPFYQCIAASITGDPVNGGWNLYAVQIDGGNPVPVDTLNDFPAFGVWNDGCLYYSANAFLSVGDSETYEGVIFGTFQLSDLYAGNPLTGSLGYLDDTVNTYAMLPATALGKATGSFPPMGTPEYYGYESPPFYDYEIRTLVPGASCGAGGTLSPATTVVQDEYGIAQDLSAAPQPNTGVLLDFVTDFGFSTGCCGSPMVTSDRLSQQKLYYRNVAGAESLWVIHGTLGAGTANAQPQWAQIDVTGGVIAGTPVQQGFYAPDASLYRWMPSMAIDNTGDAAIAYSTSNETAPNFPSISYAGRLVTDPLNSMPQSEARLIAGGGSQTGASAWGLFSSMGMDESDDCTFWYTNEYYDTQADGNTGNWQTRIGSFVFPSCVPVTNGMAITKSHTGNFATGQSGAQYTIAASNRGPGFAYGTTAVVDTLPAPLAATAITGAGWSCVLGSLTCTRNDDLAAGNSYPAITLTVDVPCTASAGTVTNSVMVSGGGDPNSHIAADPTAIVPGTGCPTTTTVTSSLNPSSFGQSVTFTAVVSPSPGPTGTVAFTADGTTLSGCTALVLSAGQAQCATTALSVGTHSVIATYSGDSTHSGSSGSLAQLVNAVSTSTTTTVTSSLNPSTFGQSVTFTATINPSSGPTGTVAFTADGTIISGCGAVVLASGQAMCSTSTLPLGTDQIAATYSGETNYSGSSGSLSQVVTAPSSGGSFTISATPSYQEVKGGDSAAYRVTLTSVGGFAGTVALACAGQPAGGSYSFAQDTLALAANGTAQTMMTVGTTTSDAALSWAPAYDVGLARRGGPAVTAVPRPQLTPGGAMLALLLAGFFQWRGRPRLRKPSGPVIGLLTLAALMIVASGCGCPSTQHEAYTITITGSSGTQTASTSVSLLVGRRQLQ